jgi:hypothetical protein
VVAEELEVVDTGHYRTDHHGRKAALWRQQRDNGDPSYEQWINHRQSEDLRTRQQETKPWWKIHKLESNYEQKPDSVAGRRHSTESEKFRRDDPCITVAMESGGGPVAGTPLAARTRNRAGTWTEDRTCGPNPWCMTRNRAVGKRDLGRTACRQEKNGARQIRRTKKTRLHGAKKIAAKTELNNTTEREISEEKGFGGTTKTKHRRLNRTSDLAASPKKGEEHTWNQKTNFLLQSKQDFNRNTEVITLPPFLIIGMKRYFMTH